MSELTGGNFKDGFIGAGVGALLSPMTGALNKGLGLGDAGTGTGWQFLGRTATAGVVGGTATAISGGKFGNGAVTAAFMHVVNDEAVGLAEKWAKDVRMEAWARDDSLERAFLINREAMDWGEGDIHSNGETMWTGAQINFKGARFYDISNSQPKSDWAADFANSGPFDLVGVVDHGSPGDQWFLDPGGLKPDNANWELITSRVKSGGAVLLLGCEVGKGGDRYVQNLALSVKDKQIAVLAGSTGFYHKFGQFDVPGSQVVSQYRGSSRLFTHRYNYKTNLDNE